MTAITLIHHTLRRGGGKERYALALAGALRALGRDVHFVCMEADRAAAASVGVEVVLLQVPKRPRLLQDYRFCRKVEAIQARLSGIEIGLSRVPARDVHVSGGTHRGHLQFARKFAGPFDYLRIWLERKTYAAARVVVAHSELLRGQLTSLYQLPPEKVRTLFAPVDERFLPPRFSASRTELRRRLGFGEREVVFLFPSSGHGRKGLAPVLGAMEAFRGKARLVVAGKRGPRSAVGCDFLGYLENLPDAYHAADFTILGSYYEPFGLVGPESLLCGTRLLFEENVGCLAAVNGGYVQTFSVWKPASIREALAKAVELAVEGKHRDVEGAKALRYDPDPQEHAKEILSLIEAEKRFDRGADR